jgi:hypothetical protein
MHLSWLLKGLELHVSWFVKIYLDLRLDGHETGLCEQIRQCQIPGKHDIPEGEEIHGFIHQEHPFTRISSAR